MASLTALTLRAGAYRDARRRVRSRAPGGGWQWVSAEPRVRLEGAERITIGRPCRLLTGACLIADEGGTIAVGGGGFIGRWTVIQAAGGRVDIGDRSNIGDGCSLYGQGGLRIGDDVTIASGCRIMTADKHLVGRAGLIREGKQVLVETVISNDVWLGANVCVLAGVTIGPGSAIGAGAVVTSDLPAFSIAVGVPARRVRTR